MIKKLLPLLLLFIACKKESKPVYNNCKILSLSILNYAPLAPDGSGWDLLNGPDIYFDIRDAGGVQLAGGSKYDDVTPSRLPLNWQWTQAFQLTNLEAQYYIRIIDQDSPDPDDIICSIPFKAATYSHDYPQTIEIMSGSNKIHLQVTWY